MADTQDMLLREDLHAVLGTYHLELVNAPDAGHAFPSFTPLISLSST